MSRAFCDIGVADYHPATLRHQHKALEGPVDTVKEALNEFPYDDFRNEAQASGSTKACQLASWHRDSFPWVTDKVCFAAGFVL